MYIHYDKKKPKISMKHVLKILCARVVRALAITVLHIHVIIALIYNWSTEKNSRRRKTGKKHMHTSLCKN